jgi:hypothetical protein
MTNNSGLLNLFAFFIPVPWQSGQWKSFSLQGVAASWNEWVIKKSHAMGAGLTLLFSGYKISSLSTKKHWSECLSIVHNNMDICWHCHA